jgi:Fe2+ transport system protein B
MSDNKGTQPRKQPYRSAKNNPIKKPVGVAKKAVETKNTPSARSQRESVLQSSLKKGGKEERRKKEVEEEQRKKEAEEEEQTTVSVLTEEFSKLSMKDGKIEGTFLNITLLITTFSFLFSNSGKLQDLFGKRLL